MSLDELIQRVSAASGDPEVQRFSKLLRDWKLDDASVDQLLESAEQCLGRDGVRSASDHERVGALWREFREAAIVPLAGTTMNERLFWFSLMPQFDESETDDDRSRLYAKLLASP